MKGSYRISRLLKRFISNGFGDTFQEPELSDTGKQQAHEHYSENRRTPVLKSKDPLSDHDTESARQTYLTYQKEFEAGKVGAGKRPPKSPGKILKLPLDEG